MKNQEDKKKIATQLERQRGYLSAKDTSIKIKKKRFKNDSRESKKRARARERERERERERQTERQRETEREKMKGEEQERDCRNSDTKEDSVIYCVRNRQKNIYKKPVKNNRRGA